LDAVPDTQLPEYLLDVRPDSVLAQVNAASVSRLEKPDATRGAADARSQRAEGGPRKICWTHPDEVNPALLEFLAA
jgi:hypothetical protein